VGAVVSDITLDELLFAIAQNIADELSPNAPELENLLQQWIKPGTATIKDCKKSNKCTGQAGDTHPTANH
jgi:hypothetical protein